MKIIINADDFGLTEGQNQGIIEAYQNGVVTSTTIMMNASATDHAVALAKENPGLGVGVHFVMDVNQPITDPTLVPSLVTAEGNFKRFDLSKPIDVNPQEVELELIAQIEKALSRGLTIDHLDSHHHIHLHPEVFESFVKVAHSYQWPIRFDFNGNQPFYLDLLKHYKVPYVYATFEFYKEDLEPAFFETIESKAQGEEIIEVMCHPAIVDQELMKVSSYNIHRKIELEVLTDPQTKEILKKHHLITYKQINEGEIERMKTIILLCSAGMSTSLLVTRMQKAAAELNYPCHIEAYGTTMVDEAAKVADVILLGPQVRFELNNIRNRVKIPVDVINMRDYGTVNGKAVLDHALKLLGDE